MHDISICLAQSPKRRVWPSMRVTRPDPERLGSLPSETKETEEAQERERESEGRSLGTRSAYRSFFLGFSFGFVLCFMFPLEALFQIVQKRGGVGNAVEARSDEIRASGVGHGSAHV
jgi:hypothetical protein